MSALTKGFKKVVGESFKKGWFSFTDSLKSLWNNITGAGLTPAQEQANEFSANEAQKQRDWETQMSNSAFQRQVADMQAAGVNPALMYGAGSSGASTPSGSSPSSVNPSQGITMSDLMQAFLLKKQGNLLDAQTRNTDADTDKKSSETDYQKLVNQYFPAMKSTELDKMLADIGLTNEQIRKAKSEVDVLELDKELKRIDKIIKQAEADESSAYFKARRELEQATTDKEKAEKEEILMRKAIELIEKEYMQKTNTKMGTPQLISLAAGIGTLLHGVSGDVPTAGEDGSIFDPKSGSESFKRDMRRLAEWILETWSGGIGN